MKTKTLIEKQTQKKTNSELVETIIGAKKKEAWLEIAGLLSGPSRTRSAVNLEQINKESKEGDVVIVPGKVLSQGELNKKIKVVALSFSEKAKEKLSKAKVDFNSIREELNKNAKAEGIRIIK